MKCWKDFLPNQVRLFLLENRYLFKEMFKNHSKYLRKLLTVNQTKSLPIKNPDNWIRKFNRLTYAYPDLIEVAEAFCESQIYIIQEREVSNNDVLAICVAKNDLIKIKEFIKYHRSIGVDKFIILDNDSSDGSVEWLKSQDDVVLMQTKTPYTTNRREGWINRIMAYYGDLRWYIVVDSDELLTYNECEKRDIHELISYFEKNHITRVRGMMIDMYAKSDYYESGNAIDYLKECVYFDKSTYYYENLYFMDSIRGGPRDRIFHQAPMLTKYPLFYLTEEEVECKSHFFFPFAKNIETKCNLIIRHYKFQPGEIEKIRKIAHDGNYYNGSEQYKKYLQIIEGQDKLDFMCEDSTKYMSSESLNQINLYNPIQWWEG